MRRLFKNKYRKRTLWTGLLGENNSLTFVYRNLESSSTRNTLISKFQIYFSQTFPLIVKQSLDKKTVQFKEYRTRTLVTGTFLEIHFITEINILFLTRI